MAPIIPRITSTRQFGTLPLGRCTKTDDTDLFAICRAAVNGFGLIEPPTDESQARLRLLALHRRDRSACALSAVTSRAGRVRPRPRAGRR